MLMIANIWRAREAYQLGRRLQAAVERGRALHPWVSRPHSMVALAMEMVELRNEVVGGDERRMMEEAIDVCVVALRVAEGR